MSIVEGRTTDKGHKISTGFPDLMQKTIMITKTVQAINGNAALTPKEKVAMIKKLPGITRQEMTTCLNQLYGGGTHLSLFVAEFLNPTRRARVEKQGLIAKVKKKS